MNTLTNLQWFNIEGKRTDGQINRATASAPAQIWLLMSAKPTLVQHVACCCTERGSVSVCECMFMSEQSQCFLLPDDEGREECHGGPPGAELGTLTSARKWSVAHTSRLPGDFFLSTCL